MRSKLMAVTLLVLVVVVAGCGGGKKSAGAATTATESTTTSAATTAASTTQVAPTFASTKNCQSLLALGVKMSQALRSSGGGLSTIGDEANVLKALASAAPSEIRGDFETFAGAFSAYAQALTKAGFKAGKTPDAAQLAALAAAGRSFSAPKLQAAEQHLAAWAKANCGIGGTTTG